MITLLNKSLVKSLDGCYKWEARCHCGMLFLVKAHKVRSGHTRSCGCVRIKASFERMTTRWNTIRGIDEKHTK